MARWKKGQSIYTKLMDNLAEHVSTHYDDVMNPHHSGVIAYAKTSVLDFINHLKVEELILIHEYLMYMTEMRSNNRLPSYVYSGGDRITSVTRHLQKNIDLELSKQYA